MSCTGFSYETLDERPGLTIIQVEGKNADRLFRLEPGGHRWQRIPATEKRGRRHTSTVTVAVLPLEERLGSQLDQRDVEWKAIVGSGNGGQNRNKVATCVQMRHKPTGISVKVDAQRTQHQNRELAYRILAAKLNAAATGEAHAGRAQQRRSQVGSGERGDKVRTIRLQDGSVVDHQTGKRTTTQRYLKGFIDDLIRNV